MDEVVFEIWRLYLCRTLENTCDSGSARVVAKPFGRGLGWCCRVPRWCCLRLDHSPRLWWSESTWWSFKWLALTLALTLIIFNLLRFGGMISWIYPSESGFKLPRKPVKSSSRCTQPQLTALEATLGNFGTSRRGATWGGNDVEPWPCRWAPTPGGTSNCFVYGQGSVARCISENRWQQWQLVKKCNDFGRNLWIKQLFYRTSLGASTHRDWLLEVIYTFFLGRIFWWAMIQLLARQALEIAEDFLPPGWISSISISVDAKWTKRSNAVCLHNAKVEAWYKPLLFRSFMEASCWWLRSIRLVEFQNPLRLFRLNRKSLSYGDSQQNCTVLIWHIS